MAKLCALLVLALAMGVSARQLHQSALTVADLPAELQALNSRVAGSATTASVATSPAGLLAYYDKDYERYAKHYYDREHESYGKKHDDKYDSYERKYDDKYEDSYGKYEDSYDSYGADYGYGGKVVVKMFEKFRSHTRPQGINADTFMFTSELTCQNPKAKEGPKTDYGVIEIPVVADHAQLVTVGVCEWTVTKVAAQKVSDQATLKGSALMVCTFNAEAAHHCKNGEALHKGLTLSGQGLVYNFVLPVPEEAPAQPLPVYIAPKPEKEYKNDYEYAQAKIAQVAPEAGVDVYLTLINSVVNAKGLKYDSGAVQFFYGADQPAGAKVVGDAADPVGSYTFVFKH